MIQPLCHLIGHLLPGWYDAHIGSLFQIDPITMYTEEKHQETDSELYSVQADKLSDWQCSPSPMRNGSTV